tara:strand:+ start:473 stop:1105 length:633 start_codon:yes stop_codon:yes gene_type:complete
MSEIKLTADSGGGTVSLKGPATTTSNADVPFVLPVADGSSGQFLKTDGSKNLSFAAAGGGKLLQVVTASTDTAQSTTSTTYVDTGLTCNITTTGSNKVLCMVSQSWWLKRDDSSGYGGIKILRDSTKILKILESSVDQSPYELGFTESNDPTRLFGRFNATVLDTPGSAATYTYKTQCAVYQNSSNGTFYTQAGGTVAGKSYITLMEIEA